VKFLCQNKFDHICIQHPFFTAKLFVPFLFTSFCFAQNKMQHVEELINNVEPGWPLVKQWIDSAKK